MTLGGDSGSGERSGEGKEDDEKPMTNKIREVCFSYRTHSILALATKKKRHRAAALHNLAGGVASCDVRQPYAAFVSRPKV